jgi:hypothetical protein
MRFVASLCVLITIAGCAVGGAYNYTGGQMIPGRLISLADGTLIPLQLELSTGQGRVSGINPKTGEAYSGNYTAIEDTKYTQYTRETLLGSVNTQQAVEVSSSVPATAILVGDKGTVINLTMRIKPGNSSIAPIGYGEGTDNKGVKYNFQF